MSPLGRGLREGLTGKGPGPTWTNGVIQIKLKSHRKPGVGGTIFPAQSNWRAVEGPAKLVCKFSAAAFSVRCYWLKTSTFFESPKRISTRDKVPYEALL